MDRLSHEVFSVVTFASSEGQPDPAVMQWDWPSKGT